MPRLTRKLTAILITLALFCEMVAKRPQPPTDKYVAALQGEPILSSLLYELPDGHADLGATWVVRTKDHAYVWVFHPRAICYGR